MHESQKRSLFKVATWRLLASSDTLILGYLFTGSASMAASIAALEIITKSVLYYFHERVWQGLPYQWLERHARAWAGQQLSLFKTVSWRLVGAVDTMILSFMVTGSPSIAAAIGGTEVFTKLTLYYLHERVWYQVKWGKSAV